MSKLIKKVKWNLDGSNTEMYMYGEADFEANKAMQEPLEKLYQYENWPNMRDKVNEYISELQEEVNRCNQSIVNNINNTEDTNMLLLRCQIFNDVINDLKSRLEEVVE